MEKIGEKIRSLRNAKRMTQSELAGDQITRNMLSLIENGSALPSLQTIMYISERLGVPAGIFLARDGEEIIYRKMTELDKIKKTYQKGEYKLCASMCEILLEDEQDDEVSFMLAKSYLEIGREAFNLGRLHQSCEALDLACNASERTIYGGEAIRSVASSYFAYMMRLSPTLTSDYGYDEYSGELSVTDSFCRYSKAVAAIEDGDGTLALLYLGETPDDSSCYAEHINALLEMLRGEYVSASDRLVKLINRSDVECITIMYEIFSNLETCYREIGNYKGAYEYSVGKIELLQHMLSQTNL